MYQQIVDDGALVVSPGDAIHPRTAMGVDREGRGVWLGVVDGRQPGFSEGMTVYELAKLMLALGCWDAANLDGGGSSVMGLVDGEGRLKVMNSPSDRSKDKPDVPKIRPLPMVLTIQQRGD